ncbi:hypothetical protein V6N12_032399 [Hibiscus sabdariffa]|uniref:Uncharacterized protein n=1 Tax=Hibiscus sabdariffa TaxID=183260 RepID=A0ABR2CCG5_9ROSI
MIAPPVLDITILDSISPSLVTDAIMQSDHNGLNSDKASGSIRKLSTVSENVSAHKVVHVVEPGKEPPSLPGSGRRTSTGAGLSSLRNNVRVPTSKGGERKGDQARKKGNGRMPSKVQLGEWLGGLEAEISASEGTKSVSALVGYELQQKSDSNVQWRKNTVFLLKYDH